MAYSTARLRLVSPEEAARLPQYKVTFLFTHPQLGSRTETHDFAALNDECADCEMRYRFPGSVAECDAFAIERIATGEGF